MKELFDQKYVFILWDKELDGKRGFVAQNIASLRSQVNDNPKAMVTLSSSDDDVCPFTYYSDNEITCDYQFAYYDPYYEFRRAYNEGKQLQFKDWNGYWSDVISEPTFSINSEYRIKPEECYVEYHDALGFVIVNKRGEGHCYWTGTISDCLTWIENHKHLIDIAKAYEKGKMIQFFDGKEWKDCWNPKVSKGSPLWESDVSYRVAPDIFYAVYNDNNIYKTKSPDNMRYVLFSSSNDKEVELFVDNHEYLYDVIKAAKRGEVIEYREIDSKDPWKEITGFDNLSLHDFVHYEYRVQPGKLVPFDTIDELITHWEKMNPGCTNRPKCAMPMIWIKSRNDGSIYLITEFYPKRYSDTYDVSTTDGFSSFDDLFRDFTFLDDSIIGKKEVKNE